MKIKLSKKYSIILLIIIIFLLMVYIYKLYNNQNFKGLNYKYRNKYDVVYDFSWWVAIAKEKWKIVIINKNWEKLFEPNWFKINSSILSISSSKNVFPIIYDIENPKVYTQNRDWTITKSKYYWLINSNWKIISKKYYQEIFPERFGYFTYTNWTNYWLLDEKWNELSLLDYSFIDTNDWKIFLATKHIYDENGNYLFDKYWYINLKWEEIIPFIYDFANNFNENVAKVMLKGKVYFINRKWNKIVDMYSDKFRIVDFNNGLFLAENEEWKYWFLDENLVEKIKFEYDEAEVFSEFDKNWISLVKKWDKSYYINKNGQIIFTTKVWYKSYAFKEGMARQENVSLKIKNKWEVIDIKWNVIIWKWQLSDNNGGYYNLISGFYDWFSIISNWEKYWFISDNWKILYSPIFTRYKYFENWIAEVEKDWKRYYLYKDWFLKENLFSDWVKVYY